MAGSLVRAIRKIDTGVDFAKRMSDEKKPNAGGQPTA
jgi:hypothetical protein